MLTSEFTDEYGDWLDGTPSVQKPRWLGLTLGEMRHRPVHCVPPDTTVEDAVALMNLQRESALLVTKHDRLLGIFTERDVLLRVVSRVDGLFAAVAEMMTPEPEVLTTSTLLSCALRALTLGPYHHLPVVDEDGTPVALVSLHTIVAYLVDAFPDAILNSPPERESFPPECGGA